MADEETTQIASEGSPAGSSGIYPLLLIVLILNIALMGVVAFFQYSSHTKEVARLTAEHIEKSAEAIAVGADDETGAAKEEKGILERLDGFTANLAQGDGPKRYVRLNAVLKFSDDSKPEEIKARVPQIRDTIISILNTKRPNDLLKVEGKNYLKEEIKAAINTFLVNGNVIDIFYMSFQIN